mgnify:CR=1 FL=1
MMRPFTREPSRAVTLSPNQGQPALDLYHQAVFLADTKKPRKSSLVIGAAKDHLPLSFPRVNSNSFLLFKNAFVGAREQPTSQGRD